MSKELWFDLYVEKLDELEDAGLPSEQASEVAADWAHDALRERLADRIDHYRQLRKEGLL